MRSLIIAGNVSYMRTTICSTSLCHGPLYEVVIDFYSEDEILSLITDFWNSYRDNDNGSDPDMLKYFNHLTNVVMTGTSEDEQLAEEKPTDIEDLRWHIHPLVKPYFGQRLVWSGSGGDITKDRLFVRYHLRDYMGKQYLSGIMRRIVVFSPCILLNPGAVIVDAPGTNDPNPIIQRIIMTELHDADAVLILSAQKRSIKCRDDLKQVIKASNLVGRALDSRLSLGLVYSNEAYRRITAADIVSGAKQSKIDEDYGCMSTSANDLIAMAPRRGSASAVSFPGAAVSTYFRLFTSAALILKHKKEYPSIKDLGDILSKTNGFQVLDILSNLQQGSSFYRDILGVARLADKILDEFRNPSVERLTDTIKHHASRIHALTRFVEINEKLVACAGKLWEGKNATRNAFKATDAVNASGVGPGAVVTVYSDDSEDDQSSIEEIVVASSAGMAATHGDSASWVDALTEAFKTSCDDVLVTLKSAVKDESLPKLRVMFEKILGGRVGTGRTLPLFELVHQAVCLQLTKVNFYEIVQSIATTAATQLESEASKIMSDCVAGLLNLAEAPREDCEFIHQFLADFVKRHNLGPMIRRWLVDPFLQLLDASIKSAILSEISTFGTLATLKKPDMAKNLPTLMGTFRDECVETIRMDLRKAWIRRFRITRDKLVVQTGECALRKFVRGFITSLVSQPSIAPQTIMCIRSLHNRVHQLVGALEAGVPRRAQAHMRHQMLYEWLSSGLRSLDALQACMLPPQLESASAVGAVGDYSSADPNAAMWKEFNVNPAIAQASTLEGFVPFAAIARCLGFVQREQKRGGMLKKVKVLANVTRDLRAIVCQQLLKQDPAELIAYGNGLTVGEVLDQLLTMSPKTPPIVLFPALAAAFRIEFVVYRKHLQPERIGSSPSNKAFHIAIDSRLCYSLVPRRQPLRFSPRLEDYQIYDEDEEQVREKREAAGPALRRASAVRAQIAQRRQGGVPGSPVPPLARQQSTGSEVLSDSNSPSNPVRFSDGVEQQQRKRPRFDLD